MSKATSESNNTQTKDPIIPSPSLKQAQLASADKIEFIFKALMDRLESQNVVQPNAPIFQESNAFGPSAPLLWGNL